MCRRISKGWGGWRSAGGRPGTVCGPPCFRRREPDVFSAERPRSAVTAAAERFGAGIRGRCGVCHCRPRSHYPLDPFETKPGRAGASRAPGLLRFKPEDSPFPCRRGEQPVLLHGPVPPRAARRRYAASRNDHTPPHAMALAPDALPRDGTASIIPPPAYPDGRLVLESAKSLKRPEIVSTIRLQFPGLSAQRHGVSVSSLSRSDGEVARRD